MKLIVKQKFRAPSWLITEIKDLLKIRKSNLPNVRYRLLIYIIPLHIF